MEKICTMITVQILVICSTGLVSAMSTVAVLHLSMNLWVFGTDTEQDAKTGNQQNSSQKSMIPTKYKGFSIRREHYKE